MPRQPLQRFDMRTTLSGAISQLLVYLLDRHYWRGWAKAAEGFVWNQSCPSEPHADDDLDSLLAFCPSFRIRLRPQILAWQKGAAQLATFGSDHMDKLGKD